MTGSVHPEPFWSNVANQPVTHAASLLSEYLLDTNACIALINGKPPAVRAKFQRPQTQEPRFSCLPSPCLNFGTALQRVRVENHKKRIEYSCSPVHPLPFEMWTPKSPAPIRADLESIGKPIGAYDLIAGQAMRNKLKLITAISQSLPESIWLHGAWVRQAEGFANILHAIGVPVAHSWHGNNF